MPFERFVEPGRVAYVAFGPHRGKLVAIVDVIDQTRVLVDGPESGVARQQLRLNELHLTKFKVAFAHSARTSVVRKAWTKSDINTKWSESSWCKRVQNATKRRAMTDFDRFKLRGARKHRNQERTRIFRRMRNEKSKALAFRLRTKAEVAKIKSAYMAKKKSKK